MPSEQIAADVSMLVGRLSDVAKGMHEEEGVVRGSTVTWQVTSSPLCSQPAPHLLHQREGTPSSS